MSHKVGSIAWAREALGPMLIRNGFVPGGKMMPRRKKSGALFSREARDGGVLVFEFLPSKPHEVEFGGTFDVEFGIQSHDNGEGYAQAHWADLLSVELRSQFIRNTCEIFGRIPRPPERALEALGTSTIFVWYTSEDLEMWRAFIERSMPVVVARTESGTTRSGWLNPGPGPDCGPGRLDRKILDELAESARKSTEGRPT